MRSEMKNQSVVTGNNQARAWREEAGLGNDNVAPPGGNLCMLGLELKRYGCGSSRDPVIKDEIAWESMCNEKRASMEA